MNFALVIACIFGCSGFLLTLFALWEISRVRMELQQARLESIQLTRKTFDVLTESHNAIRAYMVLRDSGFKK